LSLLTSACQGQWEHTFVREYGDQPTEHDPDRPWLVVRSEHLNVTLADDQPFFEWAHTHRLGAWFTITLDPWELSRK
jgi:hypothetical protein